MARAFRQAQYKLHERRLFSKLRTHCLSFRRKPNEVVISLLFNNSLDKKLKNYIYKHIGKSSRKKSEKWLIQKYRVEQ